MWIFLDTSRANCQVMGSWQSSKHQHKINKTKQLSSLGDISPQLSRFGLFLTRLVRIARLGGSSWSSKHHRFMGKAYKKYIIWGNISPDLGFSRHVSLDSPGYELVAELVIPIILSKAWTNIHLRREISPDLQPQTFLDTYRAIHWVTSWQRSAWYRIFDAEHPKTSHSNGASECSQHKLHFVCYSTHICCASDMRGWNRSALRV